MNSLTVPFTAPPQNDDSFFVQTTFIKRTERRFPPPTWEQVERHFVEWRDDIDSRVDVLLELVRDIRRRGLDRSLHPDVVWGSFSVSMGGPPQWLDAYLEICCSAKVEGHFEFEFLHSHRDRAQWWRATYPPEQVVPAFHRFIVRAGWFPKGHPMLADPPSGEPR
jgi:hypothetical protein